MFVYTNSNHPVPINSGRFKKMSI